MRRLFVTLGALALMAAACGGETQGAADENGTTTTAVESDAPAGFEDTGADPCHRLGYPCDITEAEPGAMETTRELGLSAQQMVEADEMDAAVEYLLAQDEVELAVAGEDSIIFRVSGAPTSWIFAHHNEERPPGEPSLSQPRVIPASVVGEDLTGDDRVDNHDPKRALVLAPYFHEFAPWDESPIVAEKLEAMNGYRGNVTYAANTSEGSGEVTIEHWNSFDEYDVIFISSHGSRLCYTEVDGSDVCRTSISTGIEVTVAETKSNKEAYGGYLAVGYGGDTVSLGLTDVTFEKRYPDGLDNTLISFSACESGGVEGARLAASAAGDDFVTMAWTEVVESDDALNAITHFLDRLGEGETSVDAYQSVVDANLAIGETTYKNGRGESIHVDTRFEHHSPGNDAIRIIELPTILYQGSPLLDGATVDEMIVGTPGDGEPDKLDMDLLVTGLTDPSQFGVRYEIDGENNGFVYELVDAVPTGNENEYRLQHEVVLGIDLPEDGFELAAVVVLPEGGESAYRATVGAGGVCTFHLLVEGTDYTAQPGDRVSWVASDAVVEDGVDVIGFDMGNGGGGSLWASEGASPYEPGTYRFAKAAITPAIGQGYIEETEGSIDVTIIAYEPGELLTGVAQGTLIDERSGATPGFVLEFSIANPDVGLFGYGCVVGGEDAT